jgi:hypothetical protein
MSESARVLENRGSLRFLQNKMKPKTCKLLVNSILALANHRSYKDYFATTIEWAWRMFKDLPEPPPGLTQALNYPA